MNNKKKTIIGAIIMIGVALIITVFVASKVRKSPRKEINLTDVIVEELTSEDQEAMPDLEIDDIPTVILDQNTIKLKK